MPVDLSKIGAGKPGLSAGRGRSSMYLSRVAWGLPSEVFGVVQTLIGLAGSRDDCPGWAVCHPAFHFWNCWFCRMRSKDGTMTEPSERVAARKKLSAFG